MARWTRRLAVALLAFAPGCFVNVEDLRTPTAEGGAATSGGARNPGQGGANATGSRASSGGTTGGTDGGSIGVGGASGEATARGGGAGGEATSTGGASAGTTSSGGAAGGAAGGVSGQAAGSPGDAGSDAGAGGSTLPRGSAGAGQGGNDGAARGGIAGEGVGGSAGAAPAGGSDAGAAGSSGASGSSCDAPVDLFPRTVSDGTTLFPEVDDAALEVTFGRGFTFDYYGTTYGSVFLNTNGGMTFRAGSTNWSWTFLDDLDLPAIGVFWCDHSAALHGADERADQMSYQQCADRFVVRYVRLQAWFASANDSATVTLLRDGTIVMEFGEVLSDRIFTGVFDGARTDDRYPGLQSHHTYYPNRGTGLIVFDPSDTHSGELSYQTITFHPE